MRNPEKRLGINGIEEVKNHPWLSDLDWKGIKEKAIKSPFIPLVKIYFIIEYLIKL